MCGGRVVDVRLVEKGVGGKVKGGGGKESDRKVRYDTDKDLQIS